MQTQNEHNINYINIERQLNESKLSEYIRYILECF